MSNLELISSTDSRLNKISSHLSEAEIGSSHVKNVISSMIKIAMGERDEDHPEKKTLVGLAAPQIGEMIRVILFDKAAEVNKPNFSPDLQIVINPVITKISTKEELGREGCYSTGEICAAVYRSTEIKLTGQNENGEIVRFELTGLQARIVQHEVDHLNGIRCPDRIRNPKHLHLVKAGDFQDYRDNWQNWEKFYSIEEWLKIKSGTKQ